MATTVYRNCLKKFWKRMENVDVTLVTGANDTWTGNIQRYTPNSGATPGLPDYYFHDAAQQLIRVLRALTYDEVYKISPTLIKNKSAITLTSGVGSNTDKDIAFVFDRQKVYTTGGGAIIRMATMIDTWERDEIINSLNPRKTPSTTQPYFEVIDTAINVYPTSFTKIDLRYIKSVPLQVSGDNQSDPFPEILQDIWTNIACKLAAGDIKDSLFSFIMQELQQEFQFLRIPKQRTATNKEKVT